MGDARLSVLDSTGATQYVDNESVTTTAGSALRQRVETPESDAILTSILTELSGTLVVSDGTSHTTLSSILSALGASLTVSDSTSHTTLTSILSALTATQAVSDATTHTSLTSVVSALTGTLAVSDGASHTSLSSIVSSLGGTLTVSDSTSHTTLASILSALQGALTVTGTVAISGTVPVSGTFYQATQPVSGTITANAGTNLNTSALATSANLTAGTMKSQIVDGSGSVIASTSNALDVYVTGGSTGTPTGTAGTPNANVVSVQGVAGGTAVPVSGSFTANPSADVTTGPTSITQQNTNPFSGASTINSVVQLLNMSGESTLAIQVEGTYSTSALSVQGRIDGTNWVTIDNILNVTTGVIVTSIASGATGLFQVDIAGFQDVRVSANATWVSGTANVTLRASVAPATVVQGTFWQATQPISGTVTANAGTNMSTAALALETGGNLASIATTAATLATSSNQTAGTQKTQVVDGSGNVIGSTANSLNVNITGGASSALPTNAAQETGGNLAAIATSLSATNSSDSPQFVAIAGDPSGDFAGVNLLEQAMTDGTGLAINTRTLNPVLTDANNATVLSDAKQIVTGVIPVGGQFIFDTTGYQTVQITTQALAGAVTISNDLLTWTVLGGSLISTAGTITTNVSASAAYSFPCAGRYMRIVPTAAGSATIYLRNAPYSQAFYTYQPMNIVQVGGSSVSGASAQFGMNVVQYGGTAAVTGGVAGTVGVGGGGDTYNPFPTGQSTITAPFLSMKPIGVGGIDQYGMGRRALMDQNGTLMVGGQPAITTPTAIPSVPISTQEGPSGFSGSDGLIDAVNKMVMLLTEISFFIRELPGYQSLGLSFTQDDVNTFRADPSNYF